MNVTIVITLFGAKLHGRVRGVLPKDKATRGLLLTFIQDKINSFSVTKKPLQRLPCHIYTQQERTAARGVEKQQLNICNVIAS